MNKQADERAKSKPAEPRLPAERVRVAALSDKASVVAGRGDIYPLP
ncbi:hypothetical protein TCELL_0993 [Thermogladius calderae 1633]|uniref:Uncharacterized protein n=1 Tax=Thermogladius calderae (strain DSM 22663 / VKM B-2946 / 1633) TaxID=1184251 RepID=I3TF78_THEC1|nr:hypothetical protein [Thermogladius calderae]AFK51416.1 hypothetical protein TCELL_0993 [Thermogladius calderae 1633]